MRNSLMGKSLIIIVLVLGLVAPVFAADVQKMVDANFLLGSKGEGFCSATLVSVKQRLALTNYHCVEDFIKTVEREEAGKDGAVVRVKRHVFLPMDLYKHAYGNGGIAGRMEFRAEIVAHSRKVDLAVLKIVAETLPVGVEAKLPPAEYKLALGQEVYAIGNPVMLENTVTRGILSHLNREHVWEADQVAKYIQTDAAIAGGSSGGSLYSTDGYLIGVPSAGYRGAALSFAIPFTVIRAFLKDSGITLE